ncbi:MAG: DNA-directed RNA polymerase subunit omega, partial [Rhodothermales bacterium]
MPIKTIDVDALTNQVGNLYEAVVIISKRSRQVAVNTKAELDDKLSYFEGFENELDDARMSEEQQRISVEYET